MDNGAMRACAVGLVVGLLAACSETPAPGSMMEVDSGTATDTPVTPMDLGTPVMDVGTGDTGMTPTDDGVVLDTGMAIETGVVPDGGPDVGVPCTELNMCGTARCIDFQTDINHCRDCMTVCPGRENGMAVCRAAACTIACNVGFTDCNSACRNFQTDPMNCGSCGRVCAPGRACRTGACECAASGQVECSVGGMTVCVDRQVDTNHCGACGNVCGTGQSCIGGACVCPGGLTRCGTGASSTCINTQTDNANCGACGNPCTGGTTCAAGVCRCPVAGQTSCGGACFATQTDSAHCGAACVACASGQACVAGACACPTGQSLCGGACSNLQSDNANCGACGNACPSGQSCSAGACICPTGQTRCGSTCVDSSSLQRDSANCGTCGNVCSTGTICVVGRCGAPRINALHSPLVDGATQTMRIEGSFGTTASVNFPGPGGVSVAATRVVVTPSRLDVDVPSGATAGDLTIRTAGAVSNGLRFRRPGFDLGLQAFRAQYEQTDYGRQTPSLNTARVNAAWINTGAYLYVMGGANAAGTALGSVERALINADGSLAGFENVTSGLNTFREGATAVRVGDRVYLIGGQRSGEAVASIEEATVATDGALSAFTVSARALVVARSGHAAEIIGGYLYVFGGGADSIERAPIASDGTLGAFQLVSGVTTRAHRQRATVQVVGGFVYLLGGADGATALDSIERAPINAATDTISNFEMSAVTLSAPRDGASSIVLGSRVYVVGGADGAAARSSIESATITPSGNLNAFSATSGRVLSVARRGAVSTLVGNYWYLVGGANADPVTSLDRAQVNGSGEVGVGELVPATTSALATPGEGITLISMGRYVYALGGQTMGGPDRLLVERAEVGPDGTLGVFSVRAGNPLPAGSFGPFAVIRDYVYRAGTNTTAGRLYRSRLQASGDLGPWTIETLSNASSSNYGSAVVVGQNLYLLGGAEGSSTPAVDRYSINPDGSLGFTDQPSPPLPSTRFGTKAMVLPGAVYVIGGQNGSTILRDVLRSPVVTTPGGWTAETGTLNAARSLSSAQIVGDRLYVIGGLSVSASYLTTAEYATIAANGTMGSFTTAPSTSLSGSRYFPGSIVINDSLYVVGGSRAGAYFTSVERLPLR